MNNKEAESFMCHALDIIKEEDLGFTEDLTEANIIFPNNYEDWGVESEDCCLSEIFNDSVKAVEYQGRKVTLNKPFKCINQVGIFDYKNIKSSLFNGYVFKIF